MNSVLLNNVDHADLRVVTRTGKEFGDSVNQVMVFPTEFEAVQREYPILFRTTVEGDLRPFAILGLAPDENLFLVGNGEWQASYVPALLQRGPFSIAAAPEREGDPMIRIDLDHPKVSDTEGERVFLPQGGNTPFLDRIIAVLRNIYTGHGLLDPLVAALSRANLLQPISLELRVGETEVVVLQDVQTIDRQKLAELNDGELDRLHRAGFLHSAFMIAASLANIQGLADRKAALSLPDQP